MVVASISDSYKIPPSEVRNWKTSDVILMQRYWTHMNLKREEENAPDSPAKMMALARSS